MARETAESEEKVWDGWTKIVRVKRNALVRQAPPLLEHRGDLLGKIVREIGGGEGLQGMTMFVPRSDGGSNLDGVAASDIHKCISDAVRHELGGLSCGVAETVHLYSRGGSTPVHLPLCELT